MTRNLLPLTCALLTVGLLAAHCALNDPLEIPEFPKRGLLRLAIDWSGLEVDRLHLRFQRNEGNAPATEVDLVDLVLEGGAQEVEVELLPGTWTACGAKTRPKLPAMIGTAMLAVGPLSRASEALAHRGPPAYGQRCSGHPS